MSIAIIITVVTIIICGLVVYGIVDKYEQEKALINASHTSHEVRYFQLLDNYIQEKRVVAQLELEKNKLIMDLARAKQSINITMGPDIQRTGNLPILNM